MNSDTSTASSTDGPNSTGPNISVLQATDTASTMDNTMDNNNLTFDERVKLCGEQIFTDMEGSPSSIFNKDWWYGRIMDWSMKNEQFKTQMFRFVDVLPYLHTGSEVAKHLKEYFAEGDEELPSVFNFGLGMSSLAPGLLAGSVKKNVTQMAKMFITGETPADALPVLKKAREQNLCFTVDLLGEATLSEKEALDYQNRYLALVEDISRDAEGWSNIPLLDEDDRGPIPKVNVSVKVTSLYSQVKETAWRASIEKIKERLRPIFDSAMKQNVFINIDMEQYGHKDLTLQVFKELLQEPSYKDYPHWGIVIQCYLRDSYADIEDLIQFSQQRGVPFTVRLVKGAYWDYEVIHAKQNGWPIPVYTIKAESDANYEKCAELLLRHWNSIRLAIGSHNVRSIAAAMTMAKDLGVPKNALEFQMLYGMAGPIKNALIKQGWRLREYATVGELIPGMAYLVRRLLENTSNESFLRSKFAEDIATDELLKNPSVGLTPSSDDPEPNKKLFNNEPLLDFALSKNRHKMEQALAKFEKDKRKTYPLVIGKKSIKTKRTLESHSPNHPDKLIGGVYLASNDDAENAVQMAKQTFKTWHKQPISARAQVVERLADLMARDRLQLMALQVNEVGKTWSEADGDVAEAIDFCRYYARDMKRLGEFKRVGHAMGEVSRYHYQPRGVSLVIAPWNFPLAILTGMVAASMVTGNTVVMKPAEQSPIIAAQLMQLLQEAGCPPGVVNFLPGIGEEVGEYLTGHKDVDIVAFTGSKAVGLHILNKAGNILSGQKNVKKCIIEMGGKNAIIIDSDADLDEAVAGVVYSAFGFAGQKCSACSRAIVLDAIYDRFVERLHEAVKSIYVGHGEDPQSYMGPVIDEESQRRIMAMIDRNKQSSRLLFQGSTPETGHFVPPTVFVDVERNSELAQEEVFGPVLAVIKVKSLDEAIEVTNDVAYGLTGGTYSRSPNNIERIKQEVEVGNLYINRGITGALVNRHPFGGFKMSGLGSKTGGPDYLTQFMEPRVITENTMRRGFAPSEEDSGS